MKESSRQKSARIIREMAQRYAPALERLAHEGASVPKKQMIAVTRDTLVAAGVRNLKEYGYPNAGPDNILDTYVYAMFFASMLRDNLGMGADEPINALLAEIAAKHPKQ